MQNLSLQFPPSLLERQRLVRPKSYFQTGGVCRGIFEPKNVSELSHTLRWFSECGYPYFVLGAGSNSLISDLSYKGYVLSMAGLNALSSPLPNTVACGAGVPNYSVTEYAASQNLSGLEWMHCLPGQIGATTRMNARCYGSEISEVVYTIITVTATGELRHYDANDDVFHGYKDTIFMSNGEVIAEVLLYLPVSKPIEEICATMEKYRLDRRAKKQFSYPSCGCVFKNDYSEDVGVAAGFLLDKAGAKSLSYGSAEGKAWVSPYHGNFIFHKGEALSEDIIQLSLAMRERVFSYCGVWLAYEMEFLGDFPPALWQKVKEERPLDKAPGKLAALRAAQKEFRLRSSNSL
ncbi:MAG: FAD-binding protein [Proteobacteria bacterium]|nr:FAD-binding protein [Pseudomonadota bacterium]